MTVMGAATWAACQSTGEPDADALMNYAASNVGRACYLANLDARYAVEDLGMSMERLTAAARILDATPLATCSGPRWFTWNEGTDREEMVCELQVFLALPGSHGEGVELNPCDEVTAFLRKPPSTRHLYLDPCAYCGGLSQAVDHIVPRALGGKNERGMNLAGACKSCNSSKGKKSLLLWMAAR